MFGYFIAWVLFYIKGHPLTTYVKFTLKILIVKKANEVNIAYLLIPKRRYAYHREINFTFLYVSSSQSSSGSFLWHSLMVAADFAEIFPKYFHRSIFQKMCIFANRCIPNATTTIRKVILFTGQWGKFQDGVRC